jgi:hypothetical protein
VRVPIPARRLLACFAVSYATAAWMGYRWEQALAILPSHGMALRSQRSSAGELGEGASQNIIKKADGLDVTYGFLNFDRAPLQIHLVLDKGSIQDEYTNFGYLQKELDQIQRWRQGELDNQYRRIVAAGGGQGQVDRAAAELTEQYKAKVRGYLRSRGFRMLAGNVVEVDVPAMVLKSQATMRPLARIFQKIGESRGYDDATVVSAVTAMVQTAVAYRIPPDLEGERHLGGYLPPLTVLARGWGDCDTKSGLIASILTNWGNVRMIGVALPEHYLSGILRIPQKGDVMMEYGGLNFVLIEPAGPAWLPPGTIGSTTLAMLQAQQDVQLEPFFKVE